GRRPAAAHRGAERSKATPRREPHRRLRIERGPIVVPPRRDHAERPGRDVVLRIGEDPRIEEISDLESCFELSLAAHRERSEYRQVEVPAAGAVELIARRVAEADAGRLRERARVEPRAVAADVTGDVVR